MTGLKIDDFENRENSTVNQVIEGLYQYDRFRPDNEVLAERKGLKSPYLCGFVDFEKRSKLHLYIKFTSKSVKRDTCKADGFWSYTE